MANGRCYMHGGPRTTLMQLKRTAEVAELFARGVSIQEIARRAGVCKRTVCNDLRRAQHFWVRRHEEAGRETKLHT